MKKGFDIKNISASFQEGNVMLYKHYILVSISLGFYVQYFKYNHRDF